MVSCLIVEDHDLVASGIERALQASNINVAGRVTTLNDARSFPAGDVALLDLGLPDTCRLSAVASLRTSRPDLPILVLTATPDPVLAHICIGAGARGFFGKDVGAAELTAAVLRVAAGGLAVDPHIAKSWEHAGRPGRNVRLPNCPDGTAMKGDVVFIMPALLTGAQLRVLTLVACGLSNKAIAASLSVRTKSVERHLAHVRERLDLPPGESRPLSLVAERLHTGCLLPAQAHLTTNEP